MGIRWRIVVLAGLAVTLAVVGATVGAYLVVRGQLIGQIDDSLRGQAEAAERIAAADSLPSGQLPEGSPGPQAAPPANDQGVLAQLVSPDGAVEAFPNSQASIPVGAQQQRLATVGAGQLISEARIDGETFRLITVGVGSEGALMFGRSLDGVEQVLERLRLILAVIALGGVALASGLALLVGRRVVAPISRLTETAEHISATRDLGRRIDVQGSDEVARLATRFNEMLETIADHQQALGQSVASQRQLVADASHELRTPVAAIRTDIEALLAHPDLTVDERTKMLASADERIEELTELILDLIELARGDENTEEADDVRLDLIAADSIERLGKLAPERRIDADLQPTVVRARPDRLYRAINNLLDNAHKYSPGERPIEVSVRDGAVEVADFGPGIPEADLERLFDRFWRGSTSRHRPGSGLGLAIVRQVAETTGGEVTVRNLDRGGACFRLSFPVPADTDVDGPDPAAPAVVA